eukprot:TRINITY_DN5599_c0_g3_i1.p3 TRINITY_DN5599_c0_g3~~TRINITY_DN5599_c0_g3_i1.p3  ORF type:complete len:100 (-),score=0.23 TRINITY_DN5599_c0_g3_i1:545-844(-)
MIMPVRAHYSIDAVLVTFHSILPCNICMHACGHDLLALKLPACMHADMICQHWHCDHCSCRYCAIQHVALAMQQTHEHVPHGDSQNFSSMLKENKQGFY